jgi:two-component system LytT family response regulator
LSDKNEKQAQLIEDFNEELNKLKKQKESIEAIKALPLPLQNGTILQLGEVFYIEGNDNFVSLHTAKGVCHEWQTMNHYENLLAETTLFCRTHRSYLVNRLHIKKIRSKEITMTNGDVVAIATTQSTKAAVFGWLEEWGLSTNN